MRDRPMLFSAPMVRAILDGSKTQTRRVVKGTPDDWAPMPPQFFWTTVLRGGVEEPGVQAFGAGNEDGTDWITCPYGQPGDRLWVRETWNRFDPWQGYHYAADDHSFGIGPDDDPDHIPEHAIRWKPSIHMPRAASRITLEVTGVRVERLQDISDADSLAEGVDRTNTSIPGYAKERYRRLWEQINGAGSWDANPWVWVVEFARPALSGGKE